MSQTERDQKAYALAKDYLLHLNAAGITSELLGKYLRLSEINLKFTSVYCNQHKTQT